MAQIHTYLCSNVQAQVNSDYGMLQVDTENNDFYFTIGPDLFDFSGPFTAQSYAGYSFEGWYTTPSDTGYIEGVTASNFTKLITSLSAITKAEADTASKSTVGAFALLYAKYSAIPTYTITYKPGTNGTGSQQTQTKTQGVAATLKGAIFTRTGYTQTGWATSDGGTQAYSLGGTYSANANVTLYPVWTANTYTVTFNKNGGNTPSQTSKSVTYGSTYGDLATCTRTGHTFAGWYTAASGGTKIETTTTVAITAAQTLYAHWTANSYTVTVNPGTGGSGGSCPGYTFSTSNQTKTVTLPTRTGYNISSWSVSGASGGTPTVSGTTLTVPGGVYGNITLTPTWAINTYTVTFVNWNGSTLKTETVNHGSSATAPANPTRGGYTFDGWDKAFANVTSNLTVNATFTPNTYTVTFKDFDGTVLKTETVDWGTAATAPTNPTHSGYTFDRWSRDFSNVTENIEVFAIYSGAANYTIRGRRWQRLYTAAKPTPVYSSESEASLAARTICDVPWKETSGNFVSCLTAHPGTAETDEHNLTNREYFDAAAFCAGHENGMHRVHAQATCYRFALPASAEGVRMNTLKLVVSGDPYLRDGARIAVLTNDTGIIPTDCSTCRNGQDLGDGRHLNAPGVVPRTVSPDGTRWYGKTDTLQFTPTGGLTLGKYLFVFVILENYAYSRGEYVEGSACIQPNVEIGMATTVGEWTTNGVKLCYEDLSHSYNVCRDGILPEVTGEVSGVQTIMLQRSGDPTTGTLHTSVKDAQSCIGLRAIYAALYERRLSAVSKSVALASNAREGAGFVVRGDQESVGGTNVKTWQITTAALLVPFAVPVEFRADKVRLDWANWSGGATSGGRFNVWLKRGVFVTDYPADVLKNPALYDASMNNVEGYELLGTIDATQAQKTATFTLEDPLGGYVATILLTAFISLDSLNPASGMTLPQGVATSMDINPAGSSMSGKGDGWKLDITLLG